MKRLAKNALARLLPNGIKLRLKRWEQSRWNDDVAGAARVRIENDIAICEFEGGAAFRMPARHADTLRRFISDPDMRGEFFGIAARAGAANGGVLFDCGAHVGAISLLFCAMHPGNRSFAFEPSPMLLDSLRESARSNRFGGRLSVEPVAIGERDGKIEMLVDTVGGFAQIRRFAKSMWGESERIMMPVESIESAAARIGVHPTHVKIDIEGYEFEAVRGAMAYLRKHKPVLFFELHHNYLEERGLKASEVISMLVDAGYHFETYGGRPLGARALADCPLASARFVAVADR